MRVRHGVQGLTLLIVLVLILATVGHTRTATAATLHTIGNTVVEFSPPESNRRVLGGYPANDYYSLFAPGAPWQEGLSKVGIFGISYAAADYSIPITSFPNIFGFLNTHHIALSVGADIVPTQATCGMGEGYGTQNPIQVLLRELNRIKDNGGTASFLEIDEDLWFGHEDRGKRNNAGVFVSGCHYTPHQIATFAAAAYLAAKTVFPDIRVIDGEPVLGNEDNRSIYYNDPTIRLSGTEWLSSIETYLHDFKQAAGVPIYAFYADIGWREHFQDQLIPLAQYLKSNGIKLGVYYEAAPTTSDVAWVQSAEQNYQTIRAQLGVDPDIVDVISWTRQPGSLLPETQAGTLTNLLRTIPFAPNVNIYQSLSTTTSQNENDPTTIQPFTLSWSSQNVTSCALWHSNPAGATVGMASSTSGSLVEYLPEIGTHHFWIDCASPDGSVHQDLYHGVVFLATMPSATITATQSSISVGQSASINAMYTPGTGDTIVDTAINEVSPTSGEFGAIWSGPVASTTVLNPLSYTFTPTAPGTYVFRAYTITKAFSSWQQPSSVTIMVGPGILPIPTTKAQFFSDLYQCVLGRQPGARELATWVARPSEITLASMYENWFSSSEYLNRHIPNETFVTQLYNCIGWRQPDPTGYNTNVTALQSGQQSRGSLVNVFVNSSEFMSNQGPKLSNATGFALKALALPTTRAEFFTDEYACIQNRAPDAKGLTTYLNAASSTSFATIFKSWFGSSEYLSRSVPNEVFATQLYNCILFRLPTNGEYAGTITRLQTGVTRADLVKNFVTSGEFLATQGPALKSATGFSTTVSVTTDIFSQLASIMTALQSILDMLGSQ